MPSAEAGRCPAPAQRQRGEPLRRSPHQAAGAVILNGFLISPYAALFHSLVVLFERRAPQPTSFWAYIGAGNAHCPRALSARVRVGWSPLVAASSACVQAVEVLKPLFLHENDTLSLRECTRFPCAAVPKPFRRISVGGARAICNTYAIKSCNVPDSDATNPRTRRIGVDFLSVALVCHVPVFSLSRAACHAMRASDAHSHYLAKACLRKC